jgi:steroid 5-alpha reductase family enzyme
MAGFALAWHIFRRDPGEPEDLRYRAPLARAPGYPNRYALYSVCLA